MICLGQQNIAVRPFDAQAAQLRVLNSYRTDFLARHPTGIVISELEYQGGTTAAYAMSRPLRIPGQPAINRILDAMASDFRNWVKDRDFRKCDVLGIANNGRYAELTEVTTATNAPAAIAQLQAKLDILRRTVNRIHHLAVDWQPSPWRPPSGLFCPLGTKGTELRYVCYAPTARLNAPLGIVLYEIHSASLKPAANPLPVHIQEAIRESARGRTPRTSSADAWARQLVHDAPRVSTAIRVLAGAGAAALTVVGIFMLLDPVPGDELAAFSAASALVRVAGGL